MKQFTLIMCFTILMATFFFIVEDNDVHAVSNNPASEVYAVVEQPLPVDCYTGGQVLYCNLTQVNQLSTVACNGNDIQIGEHFHVYGFPILQMHGFEPYHYNQQNTSQYKLYHLKTCVVQ